VKEIQMPPASISGRPSVNRLSREKSPYLLQHAANPVDWFPWGEQAFAAAAAQDKPIFLSIGYSTCHWCHVMAHESFEDDEVAAQLNETFICIKVDREERPDIDDVYMTACQVMTGSGGWPLTIFLTPDKRPFFAATYLPKAGRFGRPGLLEIAPRVREMWRDNRDELLESAEKISRALANLSPEGAGPALQEADLGRALNQMKHYFDRRFGGFGHAPKFPMPHRLNFLLRMARRFGDRDAAAMVEATLRAMRQGGIYDQIGYGFHRYATDAHWLTPHFEKMLYDQALLAFAYLEAHQFTGDAAYAQTAREIFSYVLRDLHDPDGAFFSAEDADSEGVEGKFYLWTKAEIEAALDAEEAAFAVTVFNVREEGNFQEEATRRPNGGNILHLVSPAEELARRMSLSPERFDEMLDAVRARLLAVRERRVRPHRDDKVLADWNGLMIAALAKGAQVLDEAAYGEAAAQAAEFVLQRMRDERGRLLHRYRDGEAAIAGFVNDYAFVVWGLIELYQATFEPRWLREALTLNDLMLEPFWDEPGGGLFITPVDGEALPVRRKDVYDGALPAGNSTALHNLLRLAALTGRADLAARAARLGEAFAQTVRHAPFEVAHFLSGIDYALGHGCEAVIVGDPNDEATRRIVKSLREPFAPQALLLVRPADDPQALVELAPYAADYTMREGRVTIYVCRGGQCKPPTHDAAEALKTMTD